MHEMSLVEALIGQIARHIPADAIVRGVHLRAGALHGIEPEAMQWAWKVAVESVGWPGAELTLEILPWTLQCLECQRQFTAEQLGAPCPCGHPLTAPADNGEMTLLSITYDDDANASPQESDHADFRDRERAEAQ